MPWQRSRKLGLSDYPAIEVMIRQIDELFEVIDLGFAERCDLRVTKAAHDQVHLAGAPVPGAKQDTATPHVEIFGGTGGAGHGCADRIGSAV